MAQRCDVVEFLRLFKGCVRLDLFNVMDRDKNTQGLVDLGMDTTERKEALLGLEPEDYVKGPEPDNTDNRKEVWFFGKKFDGKEIYIKMRVAQNPKVKNQYWATIWSFHRAEYKLNYPLDD